MTDVRTFPGTSVDLQDLVGSLNVWLATENFQTQVLKTDDGATLVQVEKRGGWRKVVGMSTALNIVIRSIDTRLMVEIGAGRWMDKAAVGTVSLFILWPLAVTAGSGAWQQSQMPERVFGRVAEYLGRARAITVTISATRRVVSGPAERVNVPQGTRISIKRSRTIDRSISLQTSVTSETTFSVTELDVFTRSVRKAVEEKSGSTFRETETIEHEIHLDGNQRNEYTLVWVDTFCDGRIDCVRGDHTESVPFALREQTELQVT
jgi:hypothetical protein